jgi:hypothetical protein
LGLGEWGDMKNTLLAINVDLIRKKGKWGVWGVFPH